MEQLIMNWTRGSAAEPLEVALPEGFSFRRFDGSAADIDAWLEIVQHGLTDGKGDRTVFRKIMEEYPGYDPEGICFIEKNGVPCATASVFCDFTKRHGYVHMVCVAPWARGCGIGTALARLAVNALLECGMETAHLTTDDFRIPAIRTYLEAGFVPQRSGSEDFPARWDAVLAQLKK